jgi:GT2 family glycosyltransferase/glycosyltransferase involved in cell wall biosynthesis
MMAGASEAAEATRRGLDALKTGRAGEAKNWFGRARRCAPDDPVAGLLLASSMSRGAPAEAEAVLRALLARQPEFGAARVALVALVFGRGAMAEAAHSLGTFLAATAAPADAPFRVLARAVADAAGLPGWAGVDAGGVMSLDVPRQAGVRVMLDRAVVDMPEQRGFQQFRLPDRWHKAGVLTVCVQGAHVLGSPMRLASRRAARGVVEIDAAGDIRGWAWLPADPAADPRLRVLDARGRPVLTVIAADGRAQDASSDGVARPRYFRVAAAMLPRGTVRVVGPDGGDLFGSPLGTGDERSAAAHAARMLGTGAAPGAPDRMRPLPAGILPPAGGRLLPSRAGVPQRRPVDVIIPVFAGEADLAACLAAVLPRLPRGARVIVVDDGARDPDLRAYLAGLAHPRVTILRHARNRGYPAAANTGLRHAAGRDAVLLNPDTVVGDGWLARLARTAYARADIGSVTPATGDGTVTSYGGPGMAADFAAANAGQAFEVPVGVGFCLFMRHDCLAETGMFREDVFAQGYGEETDWSLRARHLGWRHAADMSVFVAHRGGGSFGPAGAALRARNMGILERLHPGANAVLLDFIRADSLAAARRRVDEAAWRRGACAAGAVVLVTHGQGGGVARHVRGRVAAVQARGLRAVVVTPHGAWPPEAGVARRCVLADGETVFPDLVFAPAEGLDTLAAFLAPDRPVAMELHHMLGHDQALGALAARLGVPLEVYAHDYAMVCPRVTFSGREGRYCGEPADTGACDDCVADHGDRLHEGLGAAALRARSARLVAGARRVHAPSADTARRLARYLPVSGKMRVAGWEDDGALPAPAPPVPHDGARRICVAGAIGDEKGFRVLLECARDAARRDLALHFTVVGHTRDDAALMATGRVFVTGAYEEDEAVALIGAQRPDLGFLPSVWPETWCYSLSLLWQAGLWPVAFDLGAQGARVGARGVGTLLPAGLPAARINDVLGVVRRHAA